MLKYTIRRLLWMVPVLLAVTSVTFILMHLVPGGPWDREKTLPAQVVTNLNARYGLDLPLWHQYVRYLLNLLRGDLGVSYTFQDRNVTTILRQGLPVTATLGIVAFGWAMVLGISLGMAAALRRNSATDYFSVFFATMFASIPGFVLAIVLIIIFSVWLHLLPTSGWGSPKHLLMPALALGALPAALIARITRASVLEVLRQDYVRTAYAKGLMDRTIFYKHVLRNALIPVLSIAGPELAFLVTGSFIIEQVFSVPGIGRLFVQGVFARDYGLIMGSILFYTLIIALLNLVVDLAYAVVDPRIRYA
ncbi:MAG: ABC transporter permease [Chloroflexi bacterium]|nr:ABC transporter permease [Chloroflexota bacterium]